MTDYKLITIGDSNTYDAYRVQAIGLEKDMRPLDAMSFVVIEDSVDSGVAWFGQIVQPQANRSRLGNPFDPQSITALQKALTGEIDSPSPFLRHAHTYDIQLVRQLEDGRPIAVTRRPNAASRGRIASEDEALTSLSLPEFQEDEDFPALNNVLGRVNSTNIPVPISRETLDYHILIAGATGSGKSNSLANVIKANYLFGRCTIIFDMKPDYQNIHEANDHEDLFEKFSTLEPFHLPKEDIEYWTIGKPQPHEKPIDVPAMTLPRNGLLGFINSGLSSEPQILALEAVFDEFVEENRDKSWRFQDLITYANKKLQYAKSDEKDVIIKGVPHNKSAYGAMYRRLERSRPKWVDSAENQGKAGRGGAFAGSTSAKKFNLTNAIEKRNIIVLRVGQGGRDYALLLSYILTGTLKQASLNNLPCGVQFIVDEAQNLFQESGKAISTLAIDDFKAVIRQGRSKHIGFVISVQSASKVPDDIMTNLNSKIIHRQNSREDLRRSLEGVAPDIASQALGFEPGKALVSIFKSTALLQTEMYPSPFKITEVD